LDKVGADLRVGGDADALRVGVVGEVKGFKHFYNNWICLYILLPENINSEVIFRVFILLPIPFDFCCSGEVILSALLVAVLREIIISLLPEINNFAFGCYNRELLTFCRAEINLRIIIPLVFQEVSIHLTNVAHLILIMSIYL
jgi:hypothetical protein